MGRKLSTEEFISKAKEIHGNKYNYSKTVFKKYRETIIITCPIHGDLEMFPQVHLRGSGCTYCVIIQRHSNRASTSTEKLTLGKFIEKAKEVHGDKYDYSLVKDFKNSKAKVNIICPEHGIFSQQINKHLYCGRGCKECGNASRIEFFKDTLEDFLRKAKAVHGDTYDYSLVDYKGSKIPVEIVCKVHNKIFLQKPGAHINSGHGCPSCAHTRSKEELSVYCKIKNIFYPLEVVHDYRPEWLGRSHLDIFISELNLAIEYNGHKFHHSSLGVSDFLDKVSRDSEYHLDKYNTCSKNSVQLLYIWDFENIDKWLRKLCLIRDNPKDYCISFSNVKRTIDGLACYGQSIIKHIKDN